MPVRTQKRLTARSVIASTLLGSGRRGLPPAVLVAAGSAFAIAEGTVRVALSRMVANEDLGLQGGRYVLGARLAARQERQDESRSATTSGLWDGGWELAVVHRVARDASSRAELRTAARMLRLAELRDGVWTRPANLVVGRHPVARSVVGQQCQLFTSAQVGTLRQARDLAVSLWNLDAWAKDAQVLCSQLTEFGPSLTSAPPEELAQAFVLEADVLRHLQHDPLLPNNLLPPGWPAPRLRRALETFHPLFDDRWRAHIKGFVGVRRIAEAATN